MNKYWFLPVLVAFFYMPQAAAQLSPSAFGVLASDTQKIANSPILFGGSHFMVESNGLSNKLYNNLMFSDYIDNEAKESSLELLKSNNRIGAWREEFAGISWDAKNEKLQGISYMVIMRSRMQYSGSFAPNAYEILMFGNARFEGKNAVAEKIRGRKDFYQTLQFGAIKSFTQDETKINRLGVSVGLTGGSQHINIAVDNARIYTAPYGDSLYLQGSFDFESMNAKNQWYEYGGFGLGLSAFYQFGNQNSMFTFMVEDAGFISWKANRTKQLSFDTAAPYTGAKLEPGEPVTFNNILVDISNKIDSSLVSEKKTTALPVRLSAAYAMALNQNLSLQAGVEYYMFSNHLPKFRIVGAAKINEWFEIQPGVNVLGYSNYGIELGTKFTIAKKHYLYLGSQHIEGYIIPAKTTSQGFFAQLSLRL